MCTLAENRCETSAHSATRTTTKRMPHAAPGWLPVLFRSACHSCAVSIALCLADKRMAKITPLADELRAAIALLRKRKLWRAANRLERLSQNILEYKTKTPKRKTQKVRVVGGSGRTVTISLAEELLDE